MNFLVVIEDFVRAWVRPDTLNVTDPHGAVAVAIRLVLALFCGGIIGIEREKKRRPAGFRTHILICIGAAMATLTSQYIALELGGNTDLARLGAQVIAGIGFIGAGTIIVTKRRQVKGLTTAAGLWTAAIVGLCCGAGFIEGALITTAIVIVVEILLIRFEYFVSRQSQSCNLYVEYVNNGKLGGIVDEIKANGARINDMQLTKLSGDSENFCVVFNLQTTRKRNIEQIMTLLAKLDGVVAVEEL